MDGCEWVGFCDIIKTKNSKYAAFAACFNACTELGSKWCVSNLFTVFPFLIKLFDLKNGKPFFLSVIWALLEVVNWMQGANSLCFQYVLWIVLVCRIAFYQQIPAMLHSVFCLSACCHSHLQYFSIKFYTDSFPMSGLARLLHFALCNTNEEPS